MSEVLRNNLEFRRFANEERLTCLHCWTVPRVFFRVLEGSEVNNRSLTLCKQGVRDLISLLGKEFKAVE